MKLLTAELRRKLPPLYAQEGDPDPIVHCKFFTPDSSWTWFATEGAPEDGDFRFFGYVIGLEEEWGYFVLSELESARGPLGLPIERDLYFTPGRISDVLAQFRGEHGDRGGKYRIFNETDGVYAHPDAVTYAEAQRLIAAFRQRYERQGYYASVRGHIPISEVSLKIVPND